MKDTRNVKTAFYLKKRQQKVEVVALSLPLVSVNINTQFF